MSLYNMVKGLYCVKDGKLVVEQADCIFKSGKLRRVITVVLDNDTEITCTPDHKFMLSSGKFVKAEDLTCGSSLMAFTKRLETEA